MRLLISFCFLFFPNIILAQADTTIYGYIDSVTIKKATAAPAFIDGSHGWQIFIEKNLDYPGDAKKQKIQGVVMTEFTVGLDGDVSNIKIIKSVYPSLDAEAIKLIHRSMWIPAVGENGQPVRYRIRQAIEFHL